jgi:hypothetical protein
MKLATYYRERQILYYFVVNKLTESLPKDVIKKIFNDSDLWKDLYHNWHKTIFLPSLKIVKKSTPFDYKWREFCSKCGRQLTNGASIYMFGFGGYRSKRGYSLCYDCNTLIENNAPMYPHRMTLGKYVIQL